MTSAAGSQAAMWCPAWSSELLQEKPDTGVPRYTKAQAAWEADAGLPAESPS